jgi:hypothetical protein
VENVDFDQAQVEAERLKVRIAECVELSRETKLLPLDTVPQSAPDHHPL